MKRSKASPWGRYWIGEPILVLRPKDGRSMQYSLQLKMKIEFGAGEVDSLSTLTAVTIRGIDRGRFVCHKVIITRWHRTRGLVELSSSWMIWLKAVNRRSERVDEERYYSDGGKQGTSIYSLFFTPRLPHCVIKWVGPRRGPQNMHASKKRRELLPLRQIKRLISPWRMHEVIPTFGDATYSQGPTIGESLVYLQVDVGQREW